MGYRVIQLTLCGGRDIFGHSDRKVIAQWLIDNRYIGANAKQEADVYLIAPNGIEISSRQLPQWCQQQLGETRLKRLRATLFGR